MQVKCETTWVHPLLRYYAGAAYMAMGGQQAIMQAETTKPCTDQEVCHDRGCCNTHWSYATTLHTALANFCTQPLLDSTPVSERLVYT